jgi:hypothetical protein
VYGSLQVPTTVPTKVDAKVGKYSVHAGRSWYRLFAKLIPVKSTRGNKPVETSVDVKIKQSRGDCARTINIEACCFRGEMSAPVAAARA